MMLGILLYSHQPACRKNKKISITIIDESDDDQTYTSQEDSEQYILFEPENGGTKFLLTTFLAGEDAPDQEGEKKKDLYYK